jgi:hypothetical protein
MKDEEEAGWNIAGPEQNKKPDSCGSPASNG